MRLHSLDSLKLIAAFFIVVVHSGTFPEFGYLGGGLFENCTRWALPFFFLTSGYMIGNTQKINVGKRINKLISILFWISIIYLPIILLKSIILNDSFFQRVVNLQTFFGGVYFHLWFIISLIIATLFVNYFVTNLSSSFSLIICVCLLFLCWISDLLRSCDIGDDEFYLFRMLMGTALVYVGYFLASKNIIINLKKELSFYIIFFGFVLILLESSLLFHFFDSKIHERQFPLGSVLIAFGFLIYGVSYNNEDGGIISKCGEKYSLGIYLLHPFILTFTSELFKRIHMSYSTPNLLIAFFGALAIVFLIDRYFPWLYNRINGINVH
ncbi:TPA: acyltransferase family protein [Raoultella planticola]